MIDIIEKVVLVLGFLAILMVAIMFTSFLWHGPDLATAFVAVMAWVGLVAYACLVFGTLLKVDDDL